MPPNDELILSNLKLVHFVVNKYYPLYNNDEDVEQVGKVGLCKAAQQWNPDRGAFSTYACSTIKHEIGAYLKSLSPKGKQDVNVISLDQRITDDDESLTIGDLLGVTDDWESVEDDFKRFMETLSANRQRICLILLAGGNQLDCARKLGISKMRVNQIVRRIKRDWRKFYADKD